MAPYRLGLEADFAFEAGPYSASELLVLRFHGVEAMSELFRFEMELVVEDNQLDFDALLGKRALLAIEGEEGTRYVNGIVSKFEQWGAARRLTHYYAEVVPKIWFLGHRHKSRIFQEMSVPDIIKKILTETGIPADEFQFKLQKTYLPREYCVQYRESELAFISRLMEEEGIYYFFQHTEDKHILVMADSLPAHAPIEGNAALIFHEVTGEIPTEEHIHSFRFGQEVRPGKAVLRDFDFKQPSLDLTKDKAADKDTNLEIYDYPGEYEKPSEGQELSNVRLQELQTPRKAGRGESSCRRMLPGYKFTLDRHPRPDLNREYLLTRVLHRGTQPQSQEELATPGETFSYESRFECIPSDVQFRPARVTPRPMVQGSQTAIVTGPPGEEIYPDKYGRVKVQFHWDREGKRDEKSSCWIRVSQNWAGSSWGIMFIPRIGQEVIVDFLEGNPDNPIITGRVYNGENPTPYALPADKTKSTIKSNSSKGGGGSNELRFEDMKGSEEIYLHGEKDWNIVIKNDKTQSIGHDESMDVGHDRTKHVGNDQSETIDNNKTIKVGVDHDETIGSNKTLKVGANHTESIGSNMTVNVGLNLTETVALNYAETVGVAMELTVGAAMTHTVGAALVQSVGASKAVDVGVNTSETVGANSSESVGSNKSVDVGSNFSTSVGKDDSLKVGKKLTIQAGDQITLTTGKASILMKKDGTITIQGKDISLKASGAINEKATKNIVMKGQKILQN